MYLRHVFSSPVRNSFGASGSYRRWVILARSWGVNKRSAVRDGRVYFPSQFVYFVSLVKLLQFAVVVCDVSYGNR